MDRFNTGDWAKISANEIDFGFADDKGRATGYAFSVLKTEAFLVDQNQDSYSWCNSLSRAGTYYIGKGSPTRAGKPFGPSFNYKYFDTAEDAAAWGAKQAEDCRKRYARKFAAKVA